MYLAPIWVKTSCSWALSLSLAALASFTEPVSCAPMGRTILPSMAAGEITTAWIRVCGVVGFAGYFVGQADAEFGPGRDLRGLYSQRQKTDRQSHFAFNSATGPVMSSMWRTMSLRLRTAVFGRVEAEAYHAIDGVVPFQFVARFEGRVVLFAEVGIVAKDVGEVGGGKDIALEDGVVGLVDVGLYGTNDHGEVRIVPEIEVDDDHHFVFIDLLGAHFADFSDWFEVVAFGGDKASPDEEGDQDYGDGEAYFEGVTHDPDSGMDRRKRLSHVIIGRLCGAFLLCIH